MSPLPHTESNQRAAWLRWLVAVLIIAALAIPSTADAQRKKRKKRKKRHKADSTRVERRGKTQVFDFTGLQLGGRLKAPQLLYFLDRADQELDRAALEKRSFIPEMARSMEEERL